MCDHRRVRNLTLHLSHASPASLLRKLHLKHYHGHGYDYLLTRFVPMLTAAGVERQDIETILRRNPRNIFS